MSCLVTCGATVSFDALTEAVLSPPALEAFKTAGIKQITVQYGLRGKPVFDAALSRVAPALKELDLKVQGFDLDPNLSSLISSYTLVISHAGTGSIMDALRSNRPLIVMVNNGLMDNHQKEIADAFEKDSHLISCDSKKSLVEAIRKYPTFPFKRLPVPDSAKVSSIIESYIQA